MGCAGIVIAAFLFTSGRVRCAVAVVCALVIGEAVEKLGRQR
jgi:hypothetical protein